MKEQFFIFCNYLELIELHTWSIKKAFSIQKY